MKSAHIKAPPRSKTQEAKSPILAKSFTLIELLIVVAILGILAAAVLVAINPEKRTGQARDAQRKNDLGQLKNALEAYMVVHGSYPSTGCAWCWHGDAANFGGFGYEGPTGYIPNLAPGDIKKLPQDPRGHTVGATNGDSSSSAGYLYASDGQDYKLLAHDTPENYPPASENPFFDPSRPTWAYAVWSSDDSKGW